MLHCKLGERTRRTFQILSKSSLQCNIQTRGENKKNNPDTKQIITTVQHTVMIYLVQCNILTRGENKKINPDTKEIITTVQHTVMIYLVQCNIQTRGENKKNNPDTK